MYIRVCVQANLFAHVRTRSTWLCICVPVYLKYPCLLTACALSEGVALTCISCCLLCHRLLGTARRCLVACDLHLAASIWSDPGAECSRVLVSDVGKAITIWPPKHEAKAILATEECLQ